MDFILESCKSLKKKYKKACNWNIIEKIKYSQSHKMYLDTSLFYHFLTHTIHTILLLRMKIYQNFHTKALTIRCWKNIDRCKDASISHSCTKIAIVHSALLCKNAVPAVPLRLAHVKSICLKGLVPRIPSRWAVQLSRQ